MSKNTGKRNGNLVVNWPKTPFFGIEDLCALNVGAKEITLRVRNSKEIEKGTIAEIGCRTGGQGRPKKVFSFTPVSQTTLDLAKSQNIVLVDQIQLQKLSVTPQVLFGNTNPVVA